MFVCDNPDLPNLLIKLLEQLRCTGMAENTQEELTPYTYPAAAMLTGFALINNTENEWKE